MPRRSARLAGRHGVGDADSGAAAAAASPGRAAVRPEGSAHQAAGPNGQPARAASPPPGPRLRPRAAAAAACGPSGAAHAAARRPDARRRPPSDGRPAVRDAAARGAAAASAGPPAPSQLAQARLPPPADVGYAPARGRGRGVRISGREAELRRLAVDAPGSRFAVLPEEAAPRANRRVPAERDVARRRHADLMGARAPGGLLEELRERVEAGRVPAAGAAEGLPAAGFGPG